MHEYSITSNVTGGTYTVTNERGETSKPIPYNAEPGHEREQRRMRLLPAVAKFTRSLGFRDATGREATIIAVLPDDTVTYVLGQLAEAEYPAVLVLPTDEGMRVVKLTEVEL